MINTEITSLDRALARACETCPVYRTLYGDNSLWVRPLAMFNGEVLVDGRLVPRFARVEDPSSNNTTKCNHP